MKVTCCLAKHALMRTTRSCMPTACGSAMTRHMSTRFPPAIGRNPTSCAQQPRSRVTRTDSSSEQQTRLEGRLSASSETGPITRAAADPRLPAAPQEEQRQKGSKRESDANLVISRILQRWSVAVNACAAASLTPDELDVLFDRHGCRTTAVVHVTAHLSATAKLAPTLQHQRLANDVHVTFMHRKVDDADADSVDNAAEHCLNDASVGAANLQLPTDANDGEELRESSHFNNYCDSEVAALLWTGADGASTSQRAEAEEYFATTQRWLRVFRPDYDVVCTIGQSSIGDPFFAEAALIHTLTGHRHNASALEAAPDRAIAVALRNALSVAYIPFPPLVAAKSRALQLLCASGRSPSSVLSSSYRWSHRDSMAVSTWRYLRGALRLKLNDQEDRAPHLFIRAYEGNAVTSLLDDPLPHTTTTTTATARALHLLQFPMKFELVAEGLGPIAATEILDAASVAALPRKLLAMLDDGLRVLNPAIATVCEAANQEYPIALKLPDVDSFDSSHGSTPSLLLKQIFGFYFGMKNLLYHRHTGDSLCQLYFVVPRSFLVAKQVEDNRNSPAEITKPSSGAALPNGESSDAPVGNDPPLDEKVASNQPGYHVCVAVGRGSSMRESLDNAKANLLSWRDDCGGRREGGDHSSEGAFPRECVEQLTRLLPQPGAGSMGDAHCKGRGTEDGQERRPPFERGVLVQLMWLLRQQHRSLRVVQSSYRASGVGSRRLTVWKTQILTAPDNDVAEEKRDYEGSNSSAQPITEEQHEQQKSDQQWAKLCHVFDYKRSRAEQKACVRAIALLVDEEMRASVSSANTVAPCAPHLVQGTRDFLDRISASLKIPCEVPEKVLESMQPITNAQGFAAALANDSSGGDGRNSVEGKGPSLPDDDADDRYIDEFSAILSGFAYRYPGVPRRPSYLGVLRRALDDAVEDEVFVRQCVAAAKTRTGSGWESASETSADRYCLAVREHVTERENVRTLESEYATVLFLELSMRSDTATVAGAAPADRDVGGGGESVRPPPMVWALTAKTQSAAPRVPDVSGSQQASHLSSSSSAESEEWTPYPFVASWNALFGLLYGTADSDAFWSAPRASQIAWLSSELACAPPLPPQLLSELAKSAVVAVSESCSYAKLTSPSPVEATNRMSVHRATRQLWKQAVTKRMDARAPLRTLAEGLMTAYGLVVHVETKTVPRAVGEVDMAIFAVEQKPSTTSHASRRWIIGHRRGSSQELLGRIGRNICVAAFERLVCDFPLPSAHGVPDCKGAGKNDCDATEAGDPRRLDGVRFLLPEPFSGSVSARVLRAVEVSLASGSSNREDAANDGSAYRARLGALYDPDRETFTVFAVLSHVLAAEAPPRLPDVLQPTGKSREKDRDPTSAGGDCARSSSPTEDSDDVVVPLESEAMWIGVLKSRTAAANAESSEATLSTSSSSSSSADMAATQPSPQDEFARDKSLYAAIRTLWDALEGRSSPVQKQQPHQPCVLGTYDAVSKRAADRFCAPSSVLFQAVRRARAAGRLPHAMHKLNPRDALLSVCKETYGVQLMLEDYRSQCTSEWVSVSWLPVETLPDAPLLHSEGVEAVFGDDSGVNEGNATPAEATPAPCRLILSQCRAASKKDATRQCYVDVLKDALGDVSLPIEWRVSGSGRSPSLLGRHRLVRV